MKIGSSEYSVSSFILIFIYVIALLSMGNPLVFGSSIIPVSMHVIFIIAFLYSFFSLMFIRTIKKNLIFGYILLITLIMPSVIFSEYMDVSLFKLISFALGIFSLIFLSTNINYSESRIRLSTYLSYRNINRVVLVISFIIYLLGLGYTVNNTGFAGMLNHPQVFGVYLVLLIVIELYGIRINLGNVRWSVLTVAVAVIFSLTTESRLSVISIFIILFIYTFMFFKLKISHILALIITFFLSLLVLDKIQAKIQTVLTKSGRATTTGFEALEESRGFLVSASLNNFKDNPLFGIGFQVSNGKYGSYSMNIVRDSTYGLPIEALIEKGVFWSAILEEVGFVGTFGFIIFVVSYYKKLPNQIGFIIIISFILIGFGESFFFSLGGIGAFAWCIFFMLYSLGGPIHSKTRTT